MIRKWTTTTGMASRGQIVLVDFAIAGLPKKIRPVLIVQADSFNRKIANTVVAMITTNLTRVGETSHLLIDIATPEGQQSGLLHSSVVNCNTLTTVRQHDILRVLGSLSQPLMQRVDQGLKAALGIA
jgi:mRNA interferase MazF